MKRLLIVLLMTIPAMQASAQTPQYWRGDWWQSHGFLGADSALLLRGADTSVHPPLPGFLFDTSSNDFFMWDDQIWTPITNTDTVETIEQLQNYSGASTILVLTDSLRGGLFYKSGNEIIDSGTVFNSSDGKYWVRQFNKSEGINVQWFGAHPDSSEDATSALRRAISYAAINKQQVIIPAGIYKLSIVHSDSAALKLPTNIKLIGKGNATLVISPTDSEWVNLIDIVGDSNIVISGLNLVGNRTSSNPGSRQHCHGINITAGAKNITISDCHLTNFVGDGIYVGNPAQRGRTSLPTNINIERVRIDSCYRNGISITAGEHISVRSSYLSNMNGAFVKSGIDIEPNEIEFGHVEDVHLYDLTLVDNDGYGLIDMGNNVLVENVTCRYNKTGGLYITRNSQNTKNSYFGNCIVMNNIGNGITINGAENVTVSSSKISNNNNSGIRSISSTVKINNCHIDSSGLFAIDFRGVSNFSSISNCEIFSNAQGVHLGTNNIIFSSNNVHDNGGDDYITGNVLLGAGTVVSGNRFYSNAGAGLYINSKKNIITGNVFLANSQSDNGLAANIEIIGVGDSSLISNNIIDSGDSTNKPSTGISIPSSSQAITLAYNNKYSGEPASVSDLSTLTIYERTVKGSATLSGDGTTTDFNIAISPGFTPSKIIITPTSSDAAAAAFYIDKSTITSTSFTVKATGSVPPSGTDNVSFDYELIK